MNILPSFTLTSVLLLAVAGCGKKPTIIQGQIFVVTQGGENIKMGAVPVRVIPEEHFKEIARATAAAIEGQKALEDECRASIEAKKQLLQDLKAIEPKAALEALIKQTGDEYNIQGLRSPSSDAWMEAFVRALPQTQIKTDADGRFTAEVESKVWLVAGGQRRVGEGSEEYLWVQAYQPPEKGMPQPVLISNADNVRFKEEIYAVIATLVGKGRTLQSNNSAKPSSAVIQWVAKIKEKALKLVAEANTKAEAAKKERERMAAEAKAKLQAELQELSGRLESGVIGSNLELPSSTEVKQVFCFVPPGSFTMGHPEADWNGMENQAEVKLTTHFWLAKTEVTQSQWEVVMGGNPSNNKGPNLPVENVSWEDAQAYIVKLNESNILPKGWIFSLPTEAQWEYACRAGENGSYSGGGLDEVAWWGEYTGTHEVAQKKANAWGLHDMHGNVWEWCANWAEYPLKGGIDPVGPSSGKHRVERGGGVGRSKIVADNGVEASFVTNCKYYGLLGNNPKFRDTNLGFRSAIVKSSQ